MSCMTLRLQEMTMGTMKHTCAPCCEICLPLSEEPTESRPVRATWVAATDENGTRQLRMQWRVAREEAEPVELQKSA